ncbi:MAG: hypothetical protein AAGE83_02670 [Pseudomonadota bacterium]
MTLFPLTFLKEISAGGRPRASAVRIARPDRPGLDLCATKAAPGLSSAERGAPAPLPSKENRSGRVLASGCGPHQDPVDFSCPHPPRRSSRRQREMRGIPPAGDFVRKDKDMAKLTRDQIKRHEAALAILRKDRLTDDEREQVFRDFNPGAEHMNGRSGAFFTPFELAGDFALELNGATKVIDLCAGIGALSAFKFWRSQWDRREAERLDITCVEINPAFVEIGRKLAPWARWICADVFEIDAEELGRFDVACANPPFGRVRRSGLGPRYTGPEFELHVIDLASRFADRGAFIVPAMSAPFRYSGAQTYERRTQGRGRAFEKQTGISLDIGCGVDCSIYRDQWRDVAPAVEIVCADYEAAIPLPSEIQGRFEFQEPCEHAA